MAQDSNQMVKLLKDMKKCNTSSAENIDKLLECVEANISMKDEKCQKELLEEYIKELLTSIRDKYDLTSFRMKNIEKAIKTLYTSSKDGFNSPEINKSFDDFLNNVKDFYSETKQNKTDIKILNSKISTSTNISDMTFLSEIKEELMSMNHAYKNLTDNLIKNIKPIVTFLTESDKLFSNKSAQKHSKTIFNELEEIVTLLQQHNTKDASLEEIYKSLTTSQDLKYTQGIVDCILSKAIDAEAKFDSTLEGTVNTKSDTVTMTKDEYFDLKKCTEDIVLNTDEVKQALGKIAKDIEQLPDTASLEKPLFQVYSKLDNLLANISASNVKGDIFDLNSSFSLLREDLSTVKNIIEDLNDLLSNKISTQAKNLGPNTDVNSLRETIFKMTELIPTKEDIENLLTKMEIELNSSKNDIEDIKNSQINIENSITNLATKDDITSLDDKISEVKFDREFSDIYNKTTSIEDWLVHSKIKETTEDIASRLANKADQEDIVNLKEQISEALSKLSEKDTIDILGNTLSDVSKKIEKIQEEFLSSNQIIDNKTTHIEDQLVSISEYISKLPANDEIIKEKIEEIKTLIEEKYHFEKDKSKQYDLITDKITENLRSFITDKCNLSPNEEINDAILGIKAAISDSKADQTSQLAEIISSINNISTFVDKKQDLDTELRYSISELDGLKIQISDIIDLLKKNETAKESENGQTFDAYTQNINNFISEKLEELRNDLENNKGENESQIQQGFVYNTELIEEKTDAILNLIKDSASRSEDNENFNNYFKNIEEKLFDFKQQIELLNTDLVENLTSKNESISNALIPLKDQLSEVVSNLGLSGIGQKIDQLKSIIEARTLDSPSKETSFDNISENLNVLENNIRDYILGDIDSVIIKVDELRDYIDSSIKTIVPPNPENMQELHEYVKNINEFQKSQQELIQNATDLIQENMSAQHEEIKSMIENSMKPDYIIEGVKELIENNTTSGSDNTASIKQIETIRNEISESNDSIKSMLTVAMNHDKIISAIEDLKDNFEEKLRTIKIGNHKGKSEVIPSNIDDLRDDLSHYSTVIEKLSGQNTDISNILENIKEHLENKQNNNTTAKDTDFDFSKAFEMLKGDIDLLKMRIDKVLADNNDDDLGKDKVKRALEQSNDSWLENINKYLSESKLGSMLELLNTKVDILAEGVDENMLEEISDNISEIGNDIRDVNSNIINVNETVGSVNSHISELDQNIEGFQDNITDINDNISNINSSILGVSEHIEGVHEDINQVNQNIEDVFNNINQVNENINNVREDLLDIHGSVGSVQDSLGTLIAPVEDSISDLAITDAKITSMLENLNNKIDLISETGGSITDFEEVKDLIHEQKDYIESLEPNIKMEALKKCLDNLSQDVNKLSENGDNEAIKTYLKEMKETLMGAVVGVFDQVSFVEESEDIKDFVEERTEKINENIAQITKQLQQISSGDQAGYSYSMQDIETDLSKLRLALSEIQSGTGGLPAEELARISEKLHSITSSVDSLTQEEMKALKDEIANIKEQTRFLVVSADKSYNAMVGEDFGGKINTITKMLEKSHSSDNVIRQALIYMGEWIDSASNDMNKITKNSDEIKSIIDSLKGEVPGQTKILNILEDKIQNLEMQVVTMRNIENEMTSQKERIDRLEMNIDKILSAVENMDDFGLTSKVERIDKQLAKLSTNIEKLTAYVD